MRVLTVLGLLALCGCTHVLVDDYRASWAVIEGALVAADGTAAANAEVRATPLTPLYAWGDTVTATAEGRFAVRIESFGVPSFRADVHLHASIPSGEVVDTVFRNLRVAKDGSERPDTIRLQLVLHK